MSPVAAYGLVSSITGLLIEADGPRVNVGRYCHILSSNGQTLPAEVVGFIGAKTLLMPLGEIEGISPGDRVIPRDDKLMVGVGPALLGRTLDALAGHLMVTTGPTCYYPLQNDPPSA